MEGVAGSVEGVVIGFEGLFVGVAAGALGGGVLVAAVFGDGVDAGGGDVEAAGAVWAGGEQGGDGLDAGDEAVVAFDGGGGQALAGEGGAQGGDMLRLVGAAIPRADTVATGEGEDGGDEGVVQAGAALVELVELPDAGVAVEGEDEGGGWVGIAPVYAADDLAPVGVGGRVGEVAAEGRLEGVDESLEGGEEAVELLVGEGSGVAELGDEVVGEVGQVGGGGGAVEGVVGGGVLLEVAPEVVAAVRGAGGPAGGGVAALAQAAFEHFPGVVAGERGFVEPEPGEVEAAGVIGVFYGAEEHFAAVGEGEAPLGFEVGGDEPAREELEEGAGGGVAEHGLSGGGDEAEGAGLAMHAQDGAGGAGGGLAGADAADEEAETSGGVGEPPLDGAEGPAQIEELGGDGGRGVGVEVGEIVQHGEPT